MESKKDFECSICICLLVDPVKLKCGHMFCQFCLESYFETQDKKTCPMCRDVVKLPKDEKSSCGVKLEVNEEIKEEIKETFPDEYEEMVKKMDTLKLEQAKKMKIIITYGNLHRLVPDPQKANSDSAKENKGCKDIIFLK